VTVREGEIIVEDGVHSIGQKRDVLSRLVNIGNNIESTRFKGNSNGLE
jgi:hypothetical protein